MHPAQEQGAQHSAAEERRISGGTAWGAVSRFVLPAQVTQVTQVTPISGCNKSLPLRQSEHTRIVHSAEIFYVLKQHLYFPSSQSSGHMNREEKLGKEPIVPAVHKQGIHRASHLNTEKTVKMAILIIVTAKAGLYQF